MRVSEMAIIGVVTDEALIQTELESGSVFLLNVCLTGAEFPIVSENTLVAGGRLLGTCTLLAIYDPWDNSYNMGLVFLSNLIFETQQKPNRITGCENTTMTKRVLHVLVVMIILLEIYNPTVLK